MGQGGELGNWYLLQAFSCCRGPELESSRFVTNS